MAMVISNSIYSFVVAIVVDYGFLFIFPFFNIISVAFPLFYLSQIRILISINHIKTIAIVWFVSDVHNKTMAKF